MTIIAYILALHTIGSVPPQVSAATYAAALRHDVCPVELGAYLISEHGDDWTPTPEQCGDSGRTCGPFSLAYTWVRRFGYRDVPNARGHVWHSANMAAQLVLYSQHRHHKHGPSTCGDWRAHFKAGPGGRHLATGSVQRWKKYETRIRAELARGEAS